MSNHFKGKTVRWSSAGWLVALVLTVASSAAQPQAGRSAQGSAPASETLVEEATTTFAAPPPNVVETNSKCDEDGNIYLIYSGSVPSPSASMGATQASPIRRLSVDAKSVTSYGTPPLSGYASERRRWFDVDPAGNVYEMVRALPEPPASNRHQRPAYLIVRLNDDGTIDATTKLGATAADWFMPLHFAPFLDGSFLVTGLAGEIRKAGKPFTGVFDRSGAFVAEVELSGDLALEKQESQYLDQANGSSKGSRPARRPAAALANLDEAVGGGDMITAPDGSVYLLRASSPARLYAVTPGGVVSKEIKVDAPEPGLEADQLGLLGEGRLFIVFLREDPRTGPMTVKIAVIDLSSGRVTAVLDATAPMRSGFLPACATPTNRWLFLGSTHDHKLEVAEFAAR